MGASRVAPGNLSLDVLNDRGMASPSAPVSWLASATEWCAATTQQYLILTTTDGSARTRGSKCIEANAPGAADETCFKNVEAGCRGASRCWPGRQPDRSSAGF